MLYSRAAMYFDEVARRGSIRQASEHLHIAASAIDRQILQLEQSLGAKLFERTPQGVRLTAAGELLVDTLRRSRRDFARVKTHIDDLQGLRRGLISVAAVEGAAEFLATGLASFHRLYPAIAYEVTVSSAHAVVDLVLAGEHDIGVTFNPPDSPALRVEKIEIYQLGAVVRPDHPLAARDEVSLADCDDYPLLIPNESLSLRSVLNAVWSRQMGGEPRFVTQTNSLAMIRAMARQGVGVGMLTAVDVLADLSSGALVFLPLTDPKVPLSVLTAVSSAGRSLSVPAGLLLQHLSRPIA